MLVGWCEFHDWIFWDTWQRDAHLVYVNCSKQQPVNKGVVWQYTSKSHLFFSFLFFFFLERYRMMKWKELGFNSEPEVGGEKNF